MKGKIFMCSSFFLAIINFEFHTYNFMLKLDAKRAHEYNRHFVRYMHAPFSFAR